ncbi:MAG: SPFH domain-containing protein [Candidatus Sulfotelmatobacter sp.]|jgi:regulator of protease activity HflC (stomatin/prohibitin superfamily)
MIPIPLIAAIIVVLYVLSAIKILREYERGVIFRLGRLLPNAKGPGIILVFYPVERMVRISLRQEALEVKPQDIITRDSVTLIGPLVIDEQGIALRGVLLRHLPVALIVLQKKPICTGR